jgi:Cu+-exporting ATPase
MKKQFYIKGLHCASCVYTTEKALKTIPGVKEAAVNLVTGNAVIESKEKINDSKIKDVIKDSGYKAIMEEELVQEDDHHSHIKNNEVNNLKTKTIFSLISAALIMFVIRNFYLQFILATVVQFWAGWGFYEATLPALKKLKANMDTLVVVGTSVAYLYSSVITFLKYSAMPYFETSTAIIALVLLGRYLEAKSKTGTGEAIKKLIGLQAKEAVVLVRENDERIKLKVKS